MAVICTFVHKLLELNFFLGFDRVYALLQVKKIPQLRENFDLVEVVELFNAYRPIEALIDLLHLLPQLWVLGLCSSLIQELHHFEENTLMDCYHIYLSFL